MGNIWSYFWNSNKEEPLLELTPKETDLIKTSFRVLQEDMLGAGTELFMMLFHRKPEYQRLFPFKDIPLRELSSSPNFKAHVTQVICSLALIVENVQDNVALEKVLLKLGESHGNQNILEEPFHVLRETILDLIEKLSGSEINKETLMAWDKTLKIAFKVIFDSANNNYKI